MSQKLNSQTAPFVRTFDNSRNIRNHECTVSGKLHHSQIGFERRERVIGNLGPRRRNARNQCRFPRVRIPYQPHIRQQFQLKLQLPELTWLAVFVLRRSLMGGTGKALVATPAPARLCRQPRLPVFGKIEKLFACFVVEDHSPHWHQHRQAYAIMTRAITALAMVAALCRILRVKAEMQQRIAVIGSHHHDVATPTAVAAAGATMGHVLLPAERQTAVTAVARFDCNSYFIDKHKKRPRAAMLKSTASQRPDSLL